MVTRAEMCAVWSFDDVMRIGMTVWLAVLLGWAALQPLQPVQPAAPDPDDDEIDVEEMAELLEIHRMQERRRNGIVGEFQRLPVIEQHRMQQRGGDY